MKNFRQVQGNREAFTLAEVLITLGVIGVVAAMTIPNLVNNYQEKVTIAKLKKFYSTFSQAYQMAVLEHGTFDEWGINPTTSNPDTTSEDVRTEDAYKGYDKFFEIMKPYFNYTKYEPVRTKRVNKVEGSSSQANGTKTTGGLYLADGTIIYSLYINGANDNYCKGNYGCGDVYVSLNGKTGDNDNRVVFSFLIYPDHIKPNGFDEERFNKYCKSGTHTPICTGWVLKYENMDYLKCPEKLEWNGKHKCSE